MDDMLTYNADVGSALQTIDMVLERFGNAGFLLNGEKCQFGVITIKYLGFQISEKGWVPTEDKIKTITQLAVPTTVTELKSFLGRSFIGTEIWFLFLVPDTITTHLDK